MMLEQVYPAGYCTVLLPVFPAEARNSAPEFLMAVPRAFDLAPPPQLLLVMRTRVLPFASLNEAAYSMADMAAVVEPEPPELRNLSGMSFTAQQTPPTPALLLSPPPPIVPETWVPR